MGVNDQEYDVCVNCGQEFQVGHVDCQPGFPAVLFGTTECLIRNERCRAFGSSSDSHSRSRARKGSARASDAVNPALRALDDAIAKVTWAEYTRLKERYPGDIARGSDTPRVSPSPAFVERLECAFKSIDRLQAGGKPNYDEWDAPLYVSWYQARQVHLVCAALQQYPPPPSEKPLQVIDIGCGAWAVPLALAIGAANGGVELRKRQMSIRGIEPSESMTGLGKELWLEFGCAAEQRGLDIDFIHEMIDDDSIFASVGAPGFPLANAPANSESWLLAIHALYDESKPEITRFLRDRRRPANRLRYELITTDETKKPELTGLIADRPGEWAGLKPIWQYSLPKTTKIRRAMRRELMRSERPLDDKYLSYLWAAVSWNPGNPIEKDAIWVRRIEEATGRKLPARDSNLPF